VLSKVSDVILVRVPAIGVPSAKSSSQWEAGPVPEAMYQALLTNKNQGKLREDMSNFVKIFEIYLVTQSL
jgi:hypothetical protein